MCSGSAPPAPPPPTPAPPAPTENAAEVTAARDRERRRIALAAGKKSTMLTGADGDTSAAPTTMKSLLGA